MPGMPLDLTRRGGLSYALQLPPELRPEQQMMKPAQQSATPYASGARTHGIAEALSETPRVQGGSILEAVTAALTGGLRGRDAQDERQMALDDRTTEQKQAAQDRALALEDRQGSQQLQQAQIAHLLAGDQPEWQTNGTTPYRVSPDGQVELGSGEIPRPPPASMIFQPPSGYAGTQQGLTPIPGGPADPSRPGQPPRPLQRADAQQLTRIQTAAENARGLLGLVDEFSTNLDQQPTFPGSGAQVWDPEIRNMTALSARMTGLMRPAGSGATSDFEQRLYARGAPSVDNTREANRQIIDGLRRLAEISDARQMFYEEYAAGGSLLGAERAFQQSPEFQALTSDPGEAAGAAVGAGAAPPSPRASTGNSNDEQPPEGISPEEWRVMSPEERALFRQ